MVDKVRKWAQKGQWERVWAELAPSTLATLTSDSTLFAELLELCDDPSHLLQFGAEYAEVRDRKGRSLMHTCALDPVNGARKGAALLAVRAALLRAPDRAGATPLHVACETGNRAFVRWALDARAPADERDAHARTPADLCVDGRHAECLEYVLKARPLPDARTVARAVHVGDANALRMLLEAWKDLDLKGVDAKGLRGGAGPPVEPLLHAALRQGRTLATLLEARCGGDLTELAQQLAAEAEAAERAHAAAVDAKWASKADKQRRDMETTDVSVWIDSWCLGSVGEGTVRERVQRETSQDDDYEDALKSLAALPYTHEDLIELKWALYRKYHRYLDESWRDLARPDALQGYGASARAAAVLAAALRATRAWERLCLEKYEKARAEGAAPRREIGLRYNTVALISAILALAVACMPLGGAPKMPCLVGHLLLLVICIYKTLVHYTPLQEPLLTLDLVTRTFHVKPGAPAAQISVEKND